jgi:hypothetical protein
MNFLRGLAFVVFSPGGVLMFIISEEPSATAEFDCDNYFVNTISTLTAWSG